MKVWREHSEYLLTGEWHVHTNYTDGKNTVDEYCDRATQLGVPLIAFTEHVRKELTYDFESFLSDIQSARDTYDLVILSGCEAKVLPDGSLDVTDDILQKIDYPVFSFHSFPPDPGLYIDALNTALRNPCANAWGHPGTFFIDSGISFSDRDIDDLSKKLHHCDVLFEMNRKHHTASPALTALVDRCEGRLVRGSDCHSADQLTRVKV